MNRWDENMKEKTNETVHGNSRNGCKQPHIQPAREKEKVPAVF